ncbi:conserved hypothetical protein [Paraburkholderia ribeironis]|uniref:Zinc ribbon domain-containing protein n=1 Tax=Paraburkholderia ribeironis TaxID=1247936 RepID=A0A1N7SKD9_9BURK|nr:hypothetical protein [Paraburkholderia ribeironis]SIT47865.1 conserved hypothetical protein [Paraburkholderia ribeironis]
MSTQNALGHSFPMPCKRCGGALYRQVDYCPYCGAVHPLDTGSHKHSAIPVSRASATNKSARKSDDEPNPPHENDSTAHAVQADDAALAEPAMRTALVSPHAPMSPLDAPPVAPRPVLTVRTVLFAMLAGVAIVLAYVGYALWSDNNDSADVSLEQPTNTNQDARTTTGTIAPFAATQSTRSTQSQPPSAAVRPAVPATAPKPAPVTPPPVAAAPAKPATQFHDAAQALQAARLAFHANDLSTAQVALGAAQTLQPGNADAQNLAAELRPLTARRDAALQAAQLCVAQQAWPCARQHANEALTLDTGNDTAKSILARVIRETGWAPLSPHASNVDPAQDKPLAQAQPVPASQQAQLQAPLPAVMPATAELVPAAPPADAKGTAGTAGRGANGRTAHAHALRHTGWKHAAPNSTSGSTETSPDE